MKNDEKIVDIINKINSTLDTKTVIDLNAKVDLDGEGYAKVAKDYYQSLKEKDKGGK